MEQVLEAIKNQKKQEEKKLSNGLSAKPASSVFLGSSLSQAKQVGDSAQYSQGIAKQMPEATFRAGSIQVAVWANDTGQGKYYTISLKKEYKDKTEWKSTTSLRVNDLPKAATLMQKAYEYIILKQGDVIY